MQPKTKSDSVIANVSYSLLFTLLLSVIGILLLPAAAIVRGQTVNTYLFVTATDSDRVAVIDPSTGEVTDLIGVGNSPIRIAMRPDGLRAFVSNTGSDSVSVINTQTKAVIGTITNGIGNMPQELAVSPNGQRLFVVHQGDSFVSVINPSNGSLIGTVNIGGTEARDVIVTSNSAFAYVANYDLGEVDKIQASNGNLTRIPTEAGPRRLAITPDQGLVFSTDYLGDAVSAIDTSDNSVTTITDGIGHHPRGIAITPDGSETWVTNVDDGTVSVIDNDTLTVIGDPITVGDTPWHVIITPDGDWAYVSNSGDATVTVINTETKEIDKTLTMTDGIGLGPFFSVINPGGHKLFVSNARSGDIDPDDGSVTVIDLNSREVDDVITGIGAQPFDLMFNTQ